MRKAVIVCILVMYMAGFSGPCVCLSTHTCLSFRDVVWGAHMQRAWPQNTSAWTDQSVIGLRATSEGQMWRTACESPAEDELRSAKEKSLSLFISIETGKSLWVGKLDTLSFVHPRASYRSLLENVSLLSDLKNVAALFICIWHHWHQTWCFAKFKHALQIKCENFNIHVILFIVLLKHCLTLISLSILTVNNIFLDITMALTEGLHEGFIWIVSAA